MIDTCRTRPCLVGARDLRAWAGLPILVVGGVEVTLPAHPTAGALDVPNLELALNGNGSAAGQSLASLINAALPSARLGLDPVTGRFAFEADEAVTIDASPVLEVLGFGTGDIDIAAVGLPPYRRVAATWFRPEPVICAAGLTMTTGGGPKLIAAGRWWPSPIAALRERGSGDALDLLPTHCIEQAIHDATGDPSPRIGIVKDRIVLAWRTDAAGLDASLVWPDQSFRDALGGTGLEEPDLSHAPLVIWTIGRVPASFVLLHDGLRDVRILPYLPGSATEAGDGVPSSVDLGRLERIGFRTWIGGIEHAEDLHRHWIRRVRPHAGRPLNIYLAGMAEPRLNLDPYEITAEQPAHSLTHTVGRRGNGYGARYRSWMAVDVSDDDGVIDFGSTRHKRAPVDLVLTLGAIGVQ